jgi:hypothetical protein
VVPLFEPVFAALERAGSRYVVVGGVAVVLQGHARFTADLDLVIDLEPGAAGRAIAALGGLGFEPQVPVKAEMFADAEMRQRWIDDKGMTVFSLSRFDDPLSVVDIFAAYPIDFEELWRDARRVKIGTVTVPVASIPHLIQMKRAVGRPQDKSDVARLEELLEEQAGEP